MAKPLLTIDDLSVVYHTSRGSLTAVDRVGLVLNRGKSLGLVGESGSGKSTIGTAIMGLLPKNATIPNGRIVFKQTDLVGADPETLRRVRWKKIAMIFQAAMNALNPIVRVGDQIAEAIRFHEPEFSEIQIEKRVKESFRQVGIAPERHNDYPHQYSGGMRQRAVIAMALACRPEIIIADEPTTALDVIVQDQILQTIRRLQQDLGIGILFISHDISVVADVCHHIGVMYAGQLVEMGTREEVFDTPAHPYTQALLAAHITLAADRPGVASIPGQSPDMIASSDGCRFCERCSCSGDRCTSIAPEWRRLTPTHRIRCCKES